MKEKIFIINEREYTFKEVRLIVCGEKEKGILITSYSDGLMYIASQANADFPDTDEEAADVLNDEYTLAESQYYYNKENDIYEI